MKRLVCLLLLVCTCVISGCTGKGSIYSGIEKQDLTGIESAKELEFIYEYRGHTDNWASSYYVYQKKDSEYHITRLFLKYIGGETAPSGELQYAYSTEGAATGSGMLEEAAGPSVIYNLGSSGGNGTIPEQDSAVKMHVEWNGGTEDFELEPVL